MIHVSLGYVVSGLGWGEIVKNGVYVRACVRARACVCEEGVYWLLANKQMKVTRHGSLTHI